MPVGVNRREDLRAGPAILGRGAARAKGKGPPLQGASFPRPPFLEKLDKAIRRREGGLAGAR